MLNNKQRDGSSMNKVIIISDPDPYVILKHIKDPINSVIAGDVEDGEPIIFYNSTKNETYIFNYLYVTGDDNNTTNLKALSVLIDPSSTLLFPNASNLSLLKLAIKSKKLLNKRVSLSRLQVIDQMSGEFDDPTSVMFTISHPVYSVSHIWDPTIDMTPELLFDQILHFLKVIFSYNKSGLSEVVETFSAFCMDVLVYHRIIAPKIKNKIITISHDLSNHPIIKSFDVILSGQESMHPIIIVNYPSFHHEAFIPITINTKDEHPLSNLSIGDISTFLSRLFHYGIVYQVSSKIITALDLFASGEPIKADITTIETSDIKNELQNLLISKYGIIKE